MPVVIWSQHLGKLKHCNHYLSRSLLAVGASVIQQHTFSTAVLGVISTVSLSEAGSNLHATIFANPRPL